MITKVPWHLWVVGGLAVLWNSVGAVDYVMTQSRNEAYMGNFTPAQLEYFYAQPIWVVCAWAVAVWASVLGSILLLLRKKLSVPVFLVSVVGVVLTSFYSYGLSAGYEIMGGMPALIFSIMILLIAGALYFYAKAMTDKGILT